MCQSGRFRQAVARAALQDKIDGPLEVDLVAGRDEHRSNPVARPHYLADRYPVQQKLGPPALLRSRFSRFPTQPALGAADGRQVEPEAEMAGDPEAARVRQPLAIDEHNIRNVFDLPEGLEQNRQFAKREQPGDVREGDSRLRRLLLDDGQSGYDRITTPAKKRSPCFS